MSDKNPTVFPEFYERFDAIYNSKTWETRSGGITLRDYFAIEIAKARIMSPRQINFGVEDAYRLADDMLEARAKQ